MRRLIVALLLVAVAPTVRAESPPPNCNRDWWEPHDDVPTQLMEVPSAPLLLLPARVLWGHDGSLLAGVSVDVRDAAGGEVAGRLDRAFYEFELETLNGILRWQPNAALVPGERYTLELTVADAPQDWEPYGCVMRKGFSRSMVFMVAAAPREPPTLGVSLQAVRSWYTQTQHGLCDQMVPQASCGNGSDYCCRVLHQPTWSFQSRIELEGALPPPIYTAVRVRVVWPDGTQWHFALHPVNDGGELTVENSATFVELSGDEAFCTTVTAHDLMDVGAVELASTRTCLGPAEVIYTSEPGPLVQCDAEECAWFEARPEPVEPGPEPVEPVEPGPEPVEPGPEAVEPDEVEGPELTADPEWDRSGGGCAGGPSSWPAWAALGLARVVIGGEGRRVVRRPARRDL